MPKRALAIGIMILVFVALIHAKPTDWENAIMNVVEKTRPSLVSIKVLEKGHSTIEKTFEFRWPEEGPKIPESFKKWFKEFKSPTPKRGIGSGFVAKVKGNKVYILTNLHVIKDAEKIEVKFEDGQVFRGEEVEIVGKDSPTDLAVLMVESNNPPPPLSFGNSDEVKVGQWVVAVGNPFGLDQTFTHGIVSAIGRSGIALPFGPEYQEFIQIDAAINPGNSGGPLLNIQGDVIGVNTAISSPNGGFIGIGFAIPSNTAKFVLNSLISKGEVERGYLGVTIQDIDFDLAEAMGFTSTTGALVTKVLKGTPAEKAGIKEGDVILEFNGKRVKNSSHLMNMVAIVPPGKTAQIVIWHDGKTKRIRVKLAKRPKNVLSWETKGESEGWLGMRVEETDSGVVVNDVDPGSPADEGGLREGDLMVKIGKVEIENLSDFERAKELYAYTEKPIVFVVKRRGARRYIAIRPSKE